MLAIIWGRDRVPDFAAIDTGNGALTLLTAQPVKVF